MWNDISTCMYRHNHKPAVVTLAINTMCACVATAKLLLAKLSVGNNQNNSVATFVKHHLITLIEQLACRLCLYLFNAWCCSCASNFTSYS